MKTKARRIGRVPLASAFTIPSKANWWGLHTEAVVNGVDATKNLTDISVI